MLTPVYINVIMNVKNVNGGIDMGTTYRTKLGIYLDNKVYAWLEAEKKTTGINYSRIIEKALCEVYSKEIEEFEKKQKQEE